jgi:hypothetical protein
MPQNDVVYLGDGVYASHDGYHIWLRTERDGREHLIALEPYVLTALAEYRARLAAQYSGRQAGTGTEATDAAE